MTSRPSLIVFGALAPWPDHQQLHHLRNTLHHNASLQPILDAIRSLGTLWSQLQGQGSNLESIGGLSAAARLSEWIDGRDIPLGDQKRNILTMPMTVVAQIVQYFNYLERAGTDIHHASILENVAAGGGIQGFCAGLLSALSVASGSTKEEIGKYAGTSVKLAFAVGASSTWTRTETRAFRKLRHLLSDGGRQ
jgi:hypothetical protein